MKGKEYLKRFYPLILILIVYLVWKYRQGHQENTNLVEFSGFTMGKIVYNVKYYDPENKDLSLEVDSLLKVWNQSLSTYIPDSEISQFNNDSCFTFVSPYFLPVLKASREAYEDTKGAFDPTVGPLIDAWGFGAHQAIYPDSAKVDSLKSFVGFDKIHFDDKNVCKEVKNVQLSFSAIAKGYAVDIVADFLQKNGIENLLVEIGGELVCKGTKPNGEMWRTAIEDPTVDLDEREILTIVNMKDKAVATSGNYRNYYIKDGKRYVHTIDPVSGFPVIHSILSASVFADNCMIADAYATAFMVMGVEKSKTFLEQKKGIDAYLIYSDEDGKLVTFVTPGINDFIEKANVED